MGVRDGVREDDVLRQDATWRCRVPLMRTHVALINAPAHRRERAALFPQRPPSSGEEVCIGNIRISSHANYVYSAHVCSFVGLSRRRLLFGVHSLFPSPRISVSSPRAKSFTPNSTKSSTDYRSKYGRPAYAITRRFRRSYARTMPYETSSSA